MAHRIKLTPSTPVRTRFRDRDAFRVRVVASDAEDMPNEIFGFQRTLINSTTDEQCDEFCFVCSPYDLSIYPADEPDLEQSPAFFRKDTVDILVPGLAAADDTLADIEAQVCHLIHLLDLMDDLEEQPAVWCPAPPEDESESASESDSE